MGEDHPRFEIEMLRRLSKAGDAGIESTFIPLRIRHALEAKGFITAGTVSHITTIGEAALRPSLPSSNSNG